MRPGFRSSREGFILLTVLMIVTLLLSSATAFTWFARQEIRRASGEEFAMKARSLAMVAAGEVAEWIAADANEYDSRREAIYSPLVPKILQYDKWAVIVDIVPQDHLIPLNALFLPDGVTLRSEYEHSWRTTWELLGRSELGDLVLDYLDRDTISRTGSREEEYFPNRAISDLSELLRLPEIDEKIIYGDADNPFSLDKVFSVWGGETVNINLAPAIVLSMLDEDLDESKIESLIAFRNRNNIRSFADLLKAPGFPRGFRARMEGVIGYKSTYFAVDMTVLDGEGRERNFSAVMKREGGTRCKIVSWRE